MLFFHLFRPLLSSVSELPFLGWYFFFQLGSALPSACVFCAILAIWRRTVCQLLNVGINKPGAFLTTRPVWFIALFKQPATSHKTVRARPCLKKQKTGCLGSIAVYVVDSIVKTDNVIYFCGCCNGSQKKREIWLLSWLLPGFLHRCDGFLLWMLL